MKENCTITILPDEYQLTVPEGSSLYTLLLVDGLVMPDDPLGDRVRLERGTLSPAEEPQMEEAVFSAPQLAEGWVLASQRCIMGDAVITLQADITDQPTRRPARPLAHGYGMVFDLGDCTLAAGLINMENMLIPMLSACRNSQYEVAESIVDRIAACKRDPTVADKLSSRLREDVNKLALLVAKRAGVSSTQVTAITVAGSYPQQRLLLGQSPLESDQLGTVIHTTAGELELDAFRADADVYFLPVASPDLGADIVSAVLAADLQNKKDNDRLTIMLDIDASCDVVIAGRGRILACAVSSDALEGSGISCGMPPTNGAITEVLMENDEVEVQTVRGVRAHGICGAGLISAVFALLGQEMLDEDGRLIVPEDLPDTLASRMRGTAAGREFVLVPADRDFPRDISINQDDVLHLQLAKGVIRSACNALLAEFNAGLEDVDEILLSESYCANLRPEPVLALGLVPEIDPEHVLAIGNASWQGAYLVLTNRELLRKAKQTAASIERLDLNTSAAYMHSFLNSMQFKIN